MNRVEAGELPTEQAQAEEYLIEQLKRVADSFPSVDDLFWIPPVRRSDCTEEEYAPHRKRLDENRRLRDEREVALSRVHHELSLVRSGETEVIDRVLERQQAEQDTESEK